jgi:hypothetical protein
LTLGSGLSFGASANARPAAEAAPYQAVDSFAVLSHLHSWRAVDDDTVIVWATPFQPYLVELAFPSQDLRFAQVVGVTSLGSRVYARFDSLRVGGIRYPIDKIYKITREEAKGLSRES